MNTIVVIHPYDPVWPERFSIERDRIVGALGAGAISVEHTGSTSVPGLAAKPVIDITLSVADSSSEATFVPALEGVGFTFRLREPDWFEHRVLVRDVPRVNLHVFSEGCSEIRQMTGFRDWLRTHVDDRDLYEATKLELASRQWAVVQDYADAKTDVVNDIKLRAGLLEG